MNEIKNKPLSREEIENMIKKTMSARAEQEYELSKKYSFFKAASATGPQLKNGSS